jgi:hypothetical protein
LIESQIKKAMERSIKGVVWDISSGRFPFEDNKFDIVKHLGNWVLFIPQHLVDDIKCPLLKITGDLFPSLAMDIIIKSRKI